MLSVTGGMFQMLVNTKVDVLLSILQECLSLEYLAAHNVQRPAISPYMEVCPSGNVV